MNQRDHFLELHVPGTPLLMPNAWDKGSAALFAALGFKAIATTSGGHAATHAKADGLMTRDEVLEHCRDLVGAVEIPVSADYENGFAHDPAEVAVNVIAAGATGLAGCSIEDFSGNRDDPIYELGLAKERVAAAAEAAHSGANPMVLTARAENYLHGRQDLDDTIERLRAFQDAGADVLYAPRVVEPDDLRQLLAAVDRPVNVLMVPGAPAVGELAELGVSRISVGGAIAVAAYGAAINAVNELREQGTAGYWELANAARPVMQSAFAH